MAYSEDDLRSIYSKTSGRCHICGRSAAWKNYGIVGARMAWEVDHSNPRARGGSDRRSNLLAAHISCNRSKRDSSTRSARAKHGRTCKPMSEGERAQARGILISTGALVGGTIGLVLAGPPGAAAGAAIGAGFGVSIDPDD